jgi:hypothetical protein
MKQTFSRARLRARLGLPALVSCALAGLAAIPWTAASAQTTPTSPPYCTPATPGQTPSYCVNWSAVINGSIHRSHNSCYLLSGTIGQYAPAPGYSYQATSGGGTNFGVFSGFWSAAQTSGLDEIFFNGFEGCGQ